MCGQNTIYLQKFDVNPERGWPLFWHQYMTSVIAPANEGRILYNAYSRTGLLNGPITFVIPVFENMPEIKMESPNINPDDFISDNTRVNALGDTVIRTGPASSYQVLTTFKEGEVATRIKIGIQTGMSWDKIILENGMTGYVLQNSIERVGEGNIIFDRRINIIRKCTNRIRPFRYECTKFEEQNNY